MSETREAHGLRTRVTLTRDGRFLALSGRPVPELRRLAESAGAKPRARLVDGSVVLDLYQAPALLASALELDWDPSSMRLARNRARVWQGAAVRRELAVRIRSDGVEAARESISDSALANRLDDHQVLNVAELTAPGGWGGCLFDEQGTGKTVTLIAAFDLLVERGEAETLLVVAPKSMVGEWAREFERFTGDLYRVVVAEGARSEKARALCSGADVVVSNYETLVGLEREVVRLARRTRLVLAVDESFYVKSPDAARTAAAARVREWCTHAFVMCGSPAPNAPDDVVSQFDLVDFGYTFAGLDLHDDRDVARAQVRDRLDSRGTFLRNLKSRVLPDLPTRTFSEVTVDLAPQQRVAYDAALSDLIVDLSAVDEKTYRREIQSFLERRSALLRICADPEPLIPGYSEQPAKIEALDRLLVHLVRDQNEKVVLWTFYRASLERLFARYSDYGLVRVDGSVSDSAERREAVRRFQEDDDVKIFLGNPAAAGAGLTLHAARYAVYVSLSNQAAHWLQSLDRIHRRGQERDVHYVTILASDTIEASEYQRLRDKADAQAHLLGDPLDRPPTRRVLLDELLASTKSPA